MQEQHIIREQFLMQFPWKGHRFALFLATYIIPLATYFSANGWQTSIELLCPGLPATWYLWRQFLRKCLVQCVWNFSSHVIYEFLNFLCFFWKSQVRQNSLDSKLFPILSHKQGSLSSNITYIFFSENIRENREYFWKEKEGLLEGGVGRKGCERVRALIFVNRFLSNSNFPDLSILICFNLVLIFMGKN